MEDERVDQGAATATEDAVEEIEPTDLEEFADWKPVVGVAVIGAFIATIFTIGVLRAIGAPHWFDNVVGALYIASPLAVFGLWARDQSALRLPGGRTLRGQETARFGRFIWATGVTSAAQGALKMALRGAVAANRVWQRLRPPR